MKKLLSILLVAVSCSSSAYNYPISRVVDGDTVEIKVDFLPKELGDKLYVRINGVDTPEKGFRAKCQKEAVLGSKASEFTKQLVKNSKKHEIQIDHWDKYGGRVLGDVILDGKSLRAQLLANGYARPYKGDKKSNWCD